MGVTGAAPRLPGLSFLVRSLHSIAELGWGKIGLRVLGHLGLEWTFHASLRRKTESSQLGLPRIVSATAG